MDTKNAMITILFGTFFAISCCCVVFYSRYIIPNYTETYFNLNIVIPILTELAIKFSYKVQIFIVVSIFYLIFALALRKLSSLLLISGFLINLFLFLVLWFGATLPIRNHGSREAWNFLLDSTNGWELEKYQRAVDDIKKTSAKNLAAIEILAYSSSIEELTTLMLLEVNDAVVTKEIIQKLKKNIVKYYPSSFIKVAILLKYQQEIDIFSVITYINSFSGTVLIAMKKNNQAIELLAQQELFSTLSKITLWQFDIQQEKSEQKKSWEKWWEENKDKEYLVNLTTFDLWVLANRINNLQCSGGYILTINEECRVFIKNYLKQK